MNDTLKRITSALIISQEIQTGYNTSDYWQCLRSNLLSAAVRLQSLIKGETPAEEHAPRNYHQCLVCCLKHLSTALVIAGEIARGYDAEDYHLLLMGNLAEAQEQSALISPPLSNRIRDTRLSIYGNSATAVLTADLLNDIRQRCLECKAEIASLEKNPQSEADFSGNNILTGCGCKKAAAK